jgi:hypothetical protein
MAEQSGDLLEGLPESDNRATEAVPQFQGLSTLPGPGRRPMRRNARRTLCESSSVPLRVPKTSA